MTRRQLATRPLTNQDLERLQELLLARMPGRPMPLDEVHGLVTAVVCAPEPIRPREWMRLVLGREAAADEADEGVQILMRMRDDISRSIRDEANGFAPLITEYTERDGEPLPVAEPWSNGFMRGVNLRLELWRDRGSAELTELLLPIVGLSGAFDEREREDDFDDPRTVRKLSEMIPDAVEAIYAYWQRYDTRQGRARQVAKTADDRPCPCGSGKSYKRCCGSATRLH